MRPDEFPCALSVYERNLRELIDAARTLPAGSRVFVEDPTHDETIRHAARQPVVLSTGEGSWFIYAGDFEGMVKYYKRRKAYAKLQSFWTGRHAPLTSEAEWYQTLIALARDFEATYVVIARDVGALETVRPDNVLVATPTASLFRLPASP